MGIITFLRLPLFKAGCITDPRKYPFPYFSNKHCKLLSVKHCGQNTKQGPGFILMWCIRRTHAMCKCKHTMVQSQELKKQQCSLNKVRWGFRGSWDHFRLGEIMKSSSCQVSVPFLHLNKEQLEGKNNYKEIQALLEPLEEFQREH